MKPLQQQVPRRGASLAKYRLIARLAGAGTVERYISALSGGTDTRRKHLMALLIVT